MDLTDRVVLITGGARMGASLGLALAARGADVAFSWRTSAAAATAAAADVTRAGRRATALRADLRNPSQCQRVVDETVAWGGRLDVLVCLASVFDRVPFEGLTADAWRDQLAIDLDASFHCARAAAAQMRASGGHIVFFTDWVAASGRPRYTGYAPYYVAKAGVIALTEALALEVAAARIQVNAIAPGPILPAAGSTEEMQQAVMNATPVGHWGGPDVVAHAVTGLLEQDWLTGQVVRVDGGRHLA